MHAERLTRLADLLRRDAANEKGVQFDLGTWSQPAKDTLLGQLVGYMSRVWLNAEPPPVDCGTTACALGLAAISGEFKEEGLDCEFVPYWGFDDKQHARAHSEPPLGYHMYPRCKGHTGFEAASALFDISDDDASYLFDPDCYSGDTPVGAQGELFVANRIERFIVGDIDEEDHNDHNGRNDPRDDDVDY